MRYHRRRRIGESGTHLGGQMMTLSVFIMMLAFFIVLNAISSERQDRSGPALRSVEQTFSVKDESRELSAPDLGGEAEAESGEGDAMDGLDTLFRAVLPGVKTERDGTRGVLHVRMTLEALAAALAQIENVKLPEESVYRWKPGSFVDTLVGIVALSEKGVSLRMDLLLNLPAEPADMRPGDPAALAAAMREAGRIGALLEGAGLSPENLSVGLRQGQPRTVDIYFRETKASTHAGNGNGNGGGP